MKSEVKALKPSEISSDVFIISPAQLKIISDNFGDAVAEAMHVRPLSQKIRQIAEEILIKTLNSARTMGE